MKGKLNVIVKYKDLTREENYKKALKHHCPLVKDGKKERKLTSLS